MTKKKNKSFNPFKMWGSYATLGLYILLFFSIGICSIFSGTDKVDNCNDNIDIIRGFPTTIVYDPPSSFPYPSGSMIVVGFVNLILYFLIGWGVHSAFRWSQY